MSERIYGSVIDTKSFKAAAKALGTANKLQKREVTKALKAAGEIVASEARRIAASNGSESIPPTIKTRSRMLTVKVVAGGNAGGASNRATAKQLFTSGYGTYGIGGTEKANKTAEQGNQLAGLWELGNRGKRSAPLNGTFRHPIFGKDVWTEQQRHSFLVPAGQKREPEVEAAVLAAMDLIVSVIVLDD
jgi:hypothetical protein